MTPDPSQTGAVISVNISTETGIIKTPVPEIVIDERGIQGDAHAGDWHRQVSLLAAESIERFGEESERRFNWGEFAENITTRGLDLTRLALLDRLTIAETGVELEVSQIGKKCHGDGCAIYREVGQCVMPKEGIFCRVVQGGVLKPGSPITHTPRPLRIRTITLSDRASRGEYADRSGPAILKRLEEHFAGSRRCIEVDDSILPDDAAQLEQALRDACAAGADVIFTTGGTGVGPRDITPDVVGAMADKIIPGIMEHIRLKYGAQKPNALLSRSVAAVAGATLIYTLPGSVRAVDEYMVEILKTVEHLFYTLHSLDTH